MTLYHIGERFCDKLHAQTEDYGPTSTTTP